jgi:hypothetical protein
VLIASQASGSGACPKKWQFDFTEYDNHFVTNRQSFFDNRHLFFQNGQSLPAALYRK